MKRWRYLNLSCFLLLVFSLLITAKSASALEETKYSVLEKEDDFEIRKYDPYIVAETLVGGGLKDAGNEGFRRLFAYISGKNIKKQSISMTAPVGQETSSEKIAMTAPVSQEKKDNQWRITFHMPAEYTLEMLPKPLDARVRLAKVPGRLVAAIMYSGTWSEKKYEDNKALLEEYIRRRGLKKSGPTVWARYDPPFMPWFLRRNEVLIAVKKYEGSNAVKQELNMVA